MMTSLSVLLATHNGAAWLPRVLDAYTRQRFQGPWRMIVVDNASTDTTSSVLHEFEAKLPLLRLFEPVTGKNRALNRALGSCDGDLIIFTDDDAPPHPGFLEAWQRIAMTPSAYDLFGGRVVAAFEEPPPQWVMRLCEESPAAFAQRNLPEGPIEAHEIFGPNMAVRKRVLDAGLRFDEGIGPNAADPLYPMGSETEFCVRAQGFGYRAWFNASATVDHIVRSHQTSLAYFNMVARRAGRRDATLDAQAGRLRKNQWAEHAFRRHVPDWLKAQILRTRAWMTLDLVARSGRWWRYHYFAGYREAALCFTRSPPAATHGHI